VGSLDLHDAPGWQSHSTGVTSGAGGSAGIGTPACGDRSSDDAEIRARHVRFSGRLLRDDTENVTAPDLGGAQTR
jgi:hypothetical protein